MNIPRRLCDITVSNQICTLTLCSHLFDVGAALSDDVFVELFEDGDGKREAVLDLEAEDRKSL